MGEPEPSILHDAPGQTGAEAPSARAAMRARDANREVVVVAGFWRRFVAALIDAAAVLPAMALLVWIAGALADVSLPTARHHTVDYWLDLALGGEPALWGAFGLGLAIAVIYLLVFQATLGRTLGMRVLGLRVIDVYGEPPALWRAGLRTAGYLASAATLGLGFVWVGFDREKRGLHDWLAGTYVIRQGREGQRPAGARA